MGINVFSVLGGSSPNGDALIPHRDPGAITGSVFIQENMNVGGAVRENNILHEFLAGNVPDFLRKFAPVTISDGDNSISYLVMPDYLSLGTDSDYVRMPMNPHTAQTIADKYDCTLPTRKMVNDIWAHAVNKLEPKPWGPPYDATMMATSRIGIQNTKIQNQLAGKNFKALTAGHKKDVVLTNRLFPKNPNKRVAIYGWILASGNAIQQLNPVSHEDTYEDYSHGIRMIANDVIVNELPMRIQDVFADAKLSALLSDEGPLTFQRY